VADPKNNSLVATRTSPVVGFLLVDTGGVRVRSVELDSGRTAVS